MADDIVVLSDSDEEIEESIWSRGSTPTLMKGIQQPKNQHGNRKNALDDEAPASKKPRFYAESSTKTMEQRVNCNTPKIPQIVAVETLATPSATPPLQLLASPPRNTNTPKDTRPNSNQQVAALDADSSKSAKEVSRRVKFTTVLKGSDEAWQEVRKKRLQTGDSLDTIETKAGETIDLPANAMDLTNSTPIKSNEVRNENKTETNTVTTEEKRPLEKEYEELIDACRKADPSADMQKLIDNKLLKYYNGVHPDFVKSRGFRKTVSNCTERIRAAPDLVYYNLKAVVDELNVRRKSKDVIITNEEASPNAGSSSTNGVTANPALNKHTEEQIKKLNKALYILKKRIYRLEEADVDLDDDNSAFLQVERFKKRACQIYEKICDLTGESKHARRLVKKPIQFSGTNYPAFNKTLQAYINRTKEFPDFFDVLRMMEHCNRQYDLKLANFEMKRIAQDAFLKVGKILQSRRKTDLYEMVTHFTANIEDPAKSDPKLLAKLNENQKTQTSISKVLETYARAQDDPDALEQLKLGPQEISKVILKANGEGGDERAVENENNKSQKSPNSHLASDDDDSDDEDDEDEEELDAHVEKLTKDNTIELSDEEVELELSNDPDTAHDKEHNKKETMDDDKSDKLTENNNILSKKTDSSVEVAIKEAIAVVEAVKKQDTIAATMTATKTTTTKSLHTKETNTILLENAGSSSAKSNTTSKTVTKDPKLLRTIAEIVISDEE